MPNCKATSFLVVCLLASVLTVTISRPVTAAGVLHVPKDYPTIQEAVDAAQPGDTIKVGPGDYAGAWITKHVKILGSGIHTRITSGNIVYATDAFSLVGPPFTEYDLNGTEIRNLAIESEGLYWGVWVVAVDDVTVRGVTITNVVQPIYFLLGNGCTISHNTITNASRAIDFRSGNNSAITHNKIVGLRPPPVWDAAHCDGILVATSSYGPANHNLIAFNRVFHQGYAVGGFVEEFYAGIALASLGQPMEYNAVIHNNVSVAVPDADYSSGITLVDYPALEGAPVSIKNNQVKHNDLRESDRRLHLAPEDLETFNEIKKNLGVDDD